MTGRDTGQQHRAATPLELFFDLCFVVAVAQAAEGLHHGVADDHVPDALLAYGTVFFAIWWAWGNFTWFASAYDTDDASYRIATLVQVVGVLVLSAGVPEVFASGDWTVMTLGYAIMRVSLAGQWLRAARSNRSSSGRAARRNAVGISTAMLGWGVLLVVPPPLRTPGFLVMVAVELAVPVWAERAGHSPWHRAHLAERHGLFTIIVLGESVLAATLALQAVVNGEDATSAVIGTILGAPLVVFAMWWIYFSKPDESSAPDRVLTWAYGHYAIFAAAAAVGAGIVVVVDEATGHAAVGPAVAASAVTVPVAVYLLSVWVLHLRAHRERGAARVAFPAASAAALAATWLPEPVLACGLALTALVAVHTLQPGRTAPRPSGGDAAPAATSALRV